MRLITDKLIWAKRHPIIDEATGERVGWKDGKIFAGMDFEWRGPLDEAPLCCSAMNDEDAKTLKAARDAAAARKRLHNKEMLKGRMRQELRAELLAELREEMKGALRKEIDADDEPVADEVADETPVKAPKRRGRPPGKKSSKVEAVAAVEAS